MVAFQSTAPDLVSAGAARPDARLAAVIQTPLTEVYEHDVVASETILVSVARNGQPGGRPSLQSTVGGNGRFVGFTSLSPRLVANDTGGFADVFVRDFPPVPPAPPAIDFGLAVGAPERPPPRPCATTVGPLVVRPATIGGRPTDYDVLADGQRRTLHRTEACTVTVSFTPSVGCAPRRWPSLCLRLSAHEPLSGSGKAPVVRQGRLKIAPTSGRRGS
jgi:hypothetical protein